MSKKLVLEVLKAYDMQLSEFCHTIGLKKTTVQTWMDNDRCPSTGKVLLETLLENKELKKTAQ